MLNDSVLEISSGPIDQDPIKCILREIKKYK